MIPPLNEHGVLPVGVHDSTLAEIEARYATNLRRRSLWSGFQRYLARVQPLGFFPTIFFGGSFVTDKKFPKDVDVALEVTTLYLAARIQDERLALLFEVKWTSQFGVQAVAWAPTAPPDKDLLIHLQRVSPSEALLRSMDVTDRKGVLRVEL